MTWYELLLSLHILSAALYIGSTLAITVISYRLLAVGSPAFREFVPAAGWWASRAHPGAAVVLLLTAILMILDADLSFGDLWITLALTGWLIAGFIGGNLVGQTAKRLETQLAGDGGAGAPLGDASRELAGKFLLYARLETAVLVLVLFDMVVKPG